MLRLTLAILAATALAGAVWAEGSQWPSEMTIGGFNIIRIRESAESSASATGYLQIPGINPDQRIVLTRGSRGEFTGSVLLSFRVSGVEFNGNGLLNASGLKATGTFHVSPKSITDSTLSVSPSGLFKGEGRVAFNSLSVPVKVSLSSASFVYSGSVSVQTECDNPLALYRFSGSLKAEGGPTRLSLAASGIVTRKGKLADQVTSHTVSDIPVGLFDGSGAADIGGVTVKFEFF